MGWYPPTTGTLLQSSKPQVVGQAAKPAAPSTYAQRRQRYIEFATQRALSQQRVNEILNSLKQDWPQPGTVRVDRWEDRKNHGFMGDKPNRTNYGKPGPNTDVSVYDKVRRISVPGNTKAIAFTGTNFSGSKRVFGPGEYRGWAARSMLVVPNFSFNRVINQASAALSDFAKSSHGCIINAENWKTQPLVQAFSAFMDKVIAAHEPSDAADEYRKVKEQVLLSLSDDVLRSQSECNLLAKPPCRGGLERPTSQQQREVFKRGGYVETPTGSDCWKAPVACGEGAVKAQNAQVQQMLQGLGYVERPPGSKCYGKPQVRCPAGATQVTNDLVAQTLRASGYAENPPGSSCFMKPKVERKCSTLWHVFPNRQRVCIPPNRYNPQCLAKGGRYEANINTRTGKIRTDTIACMIPNVQRRQIGTPYSPERKAWYADIKSRAVYPI